MTEPTIFCPRCQGEIKLTESLAAPLVETTRREYQAKLDHALLDCQRREEGVKRGLDALSKEKQEWAAIQAKQLEQERKRIAVEEAGRAEKKFAYDLQKQAGDIRSLEGALQAKDMKLAEAQQAQAEFLKKERQLADERRELELTIEKRVQGSIAEIRVVAQREADEASRLKVLEKEQVIGSMQRQIEDLKRKAEQGSQQLQGEVLELDLEAQLAKHFPFDTLEPVRKGEHGGDLVQRVVSSAGLPCGTILWECKRTKSWSDGWLPKLREDQRNAKAEIAVLVSQALPKGVESFEQKDEVWVTQPRTLLPVACLLRHSLIEIESARRASQGQGTKAELAYEYLSGPRFRQRVQAIVEAFNNMQDDLDREKRAIQKLWAKRHEQIECVIRGTAGMYGDLQAIAGRSMQEIEGLDWEAGDEPAVKRIA